VSVHKSFPMDIRTRVQRKIIARQAEHGTGAILGTGLTREVQGESLVWRIVCGS
jgi:hypothetical protein